ncbi:FAD-binding domain-containing protein [Mycena rebaudengoi]|nr:FAD-binding domain-containing protein [Mycena rebaudengoi]
MKLVSVLLLAVFRYAWEAQAKSHQKCRNVPGSAGYPSAAAWDALNATISGRLVVAVPSAKYCTSLPGGACTEEQWQRDVPLYSVEAATVADIQAAVKFAGLHNLRLVVKASGHDALGRSTAPQSLLIHTANLQQFIPTDAFMVEAKNMGSAVTLGSGLPLKDAYQKAKANGKIIVGGTAATVIAAGGYIQGAGHSALSPTFGLAADHALEFQIVVASGELLTVNRISHPDLFYALRGGGAGSWGVLFSATVRTFPTFNATHSRIQIVSANNTASAELATLHARHIFDLDPVRGSQYFFLGKESKDRSALFRFDTFMPNTTVKRGTALLAPFLSGVRGIAGLTVVTESYENANINDLLTQPDDAAGTNMAVGSRLIPEATYKNSPEVVGEVYKQLLDEGTLFILGNLVAGGQVSVNAHISNAVHPAWRTAKVHLILGNIWDDAAPLSEVNTQRTRFKNRQLPILKQLSGPNSGAYSNEADVLEADFRTTFFGPNYSKLSAIKRAYDPNDLFIVGAGVGSERWDQWGLCTV